MTSPTALCAAGYYCVSGVDRPNPLMLNDSQCPEGTVHPIIGHACPTGHFCTIGSELPEGCPPGKYQNMEGQSTCFSCPEGFYCYANTSDYSVNICPSGFYCPLETEFPSEYACPAGSFNNLTGQVDATSCLPCPPGEYCEGTGNTFPTGLCDAGWYCINASDSATVSLSILTSKIIL